MSLETNAPARFDTLATLYRCFYRVHTIESQSQKGFIFFKMNEGRLGTVRKQENSNRKYMCIQNDVAKFRQDELTHIFDHEKEEELRRKDRSAGKIRKKAVQSHVLGKCLQLNREDTLTSPTGNLYGHYNGRPIASFSSDVDNYIKNKNPKVRKQREMQDLMRKYKETGKILEEDQIKGKIRDYLTTRWGVHYKSEEKEKEDTNVHDLPQIRVYTDKLPDIFSFYKSSSDPARLKRTSDRRVSRIEIRDESGQFVPLESINGLKGHRRSINPTNEALLKRRGTLRRPSELPQLTNQTQRRLSQIGSLQGRSPRRKSILPAIK